MKAALIEVIGGPTAGGKSALALRMARERGGVVINADSMQIYGALPLLTAQPCGEDLAAAPHRLYGVLPPERACSAAQWREMAAAEIETALAAGRTPVVVGGTGLYIGALLHGLSPMPDIPADIRAHAVALQAERGNPAFHAMLETVDPVMAGRLHPNDTQRLIRAWEVFEATGRSLSAWQAERREEPPAGWRFNVTLVMPGRAELYGRCDGRFDRMMETGALDEVRRWRDLPATASVTHALGFRPLRRHLDGEIDLPEAVALSKAETRQYAKRQVTWFRHQIPASGALDVTVTGS